MAAAAPMLRRPVLPPLGELECPRPTSQPEHEDSAEAITRAQGGSDKPGALVNTAAVAAGAAQQETALGTRMSTEIPSASSLLDGRASTGSSKTRWNQANSSIKLSLKASGGFHTLRDMGGSTDIQAEELKPVKKLGEGAFAVVEEAVYTPKAGGISRPVVVKKLKPEIVNHTGDLLSFLNEISLLRKLASKRVVEYIGVGSTDQSSEEAKRRTMFLVQELMDGGTIKQMIVKQMLSMSRPVYSYDDAFRWAVHIAEGLEYLHQAQPMVIHRDIKLENILLKGTDPATAEAKIADFGLVALVRPKPRAAPAALASAGSAVVQRSQSSRRGSMKRMGSLASVVSRKPLTVQDAWNESFKLRHQMQNAKDFLAPQQLSGRTGSYMYMAPEMYRQDPYTEKVDVFSFGIVLFEMLSRYQTVCAVSVEGTEDEIEHYAAKVSLGYRPPIPDRWPENVQKLVAECWSQEPDLRPSMTQVRERLVAMRSDGTVAAMAATHVEGTCGCSIM